MARELHDVVAHGVSVMLIQAGAARQVMRTSPERADGGAAGRRGDGPRGDGRAAAAARRARRRRARAPGSRRSPGIDQLGRLSTGFARPACPPSSRSTATPRPLPPSLDVTVYRIVQEALTNALRYARRAATLVRLTWEPDAAPGRDPRRRAGRRGGCRRRLRAGARRACASARRWSAGGSRPGPRLGGGYAVRAWLPLRPEAREHGTEPGRVTRRRRSASSSPTTRRSSGRASG